MICCKRKQSFGMTIVVSLKGWSLTLWLLLLSAENRTFANNFGPRSGPTKCCAWSGSKLFDIEMVFMKEFIEMLIFKNNQQTAQSMQNYPACKNIKQKLLFLRWWNGKTIYRWATVSITVNLFIICSVLSSMVELYGICSKILNTSC